LSFKLEITVSRINGGIVSGGSNDGMVVDFTELNKIVKKAVIEKIDNLKRWTYIIFKFISSDIL
jgi:6-pyruvoyl-tetrahydropterin synthase